MVGINKLSLLKRKQDPCTVDKIKASRWLKLPSHILGVLMLGVVSQVCQVIFFREFLMVFHGNEMTFGLILSAWLFWVGSGSRLAGSLAKRLDKPVEHFLLSTTALFIMAPLSVLMIRNLRAYFDLPPGAYLSLFDLFIATFIITAPVCLLLGAQFVFLARIWREYEHSIDTSGAGKTYIGEAAGNFTGGLLFTFILVHILNSYQSAVLVTFLIFVAALVVRMAKVYRRDKLSLLPLIMIILFVTVLAAFPLLDRLDRWSYDLQWHNFSPQHELIGTYNSKHGNIAVLELDEQYTFFQSGNLVFSTAGRETVLAGLEEQDAVEFAHMAMVQHQSPEKVLLIGGGMRGTLAEIIKHPVSRVDYVELDPALIEAAEPFVSFATLKALEDTRVNVIHTDGRLYVKTTDQSYDLIIVDVPDPATAVLNRFYTREFFAETGALLESDGVFVTGIVSTPDLRGRAVANRNAAVYHTLDQVFEHVMPAGDHFLYLFAGKSRQHVSLDPVLLAERYLERGISTEGFSAQHFQTILEETQLRRVNWTLRNHGRSSAAHLDGPGRQPMLRPTIEEQKVEQGSLPPVQERYFINTDFRPIGYYYSLMFWDDLTRGDRPKSFAPLLQVQAWWILPLLILPFAVLLMAGRLGKASRIKGPASFAVLFAVFSTGLSTMALQVALLFSFQSVYGFVYEMVGLITALFMIGLAGGAYLVNRYIRDKGRLQLLATVQMGIALLSLAIALLLPLSANLVEPVLIFIFFSTLTLFAGAINGIDFPLAMACYQNLVKDADKTAGKVYGLELFGACLGALLASILIAPILGIAACAMLAALVNAAAFMVLLIGRRVDRLCCSGTS